MRLFILFISLSCSILLQSQEALIYTQTFTNLIKQEKLVFDKPDGWFKVFPLEEDEFLDYDLVLRSEQTGMDIRYVVYPHGHQSRNYPDFDFAKTMASIASNEEHHLLFVRGLDSTLLKNEYHAEWGALATFTPKPNFSEKERGKILSLHHSTKGSLLIIFLFDGSSEQANPYLKTLFFQNIKDSG